MDLFLWVGPLPRPLSPERKNNGKTKTHAHTITHLPSFQTQNHTQCPLVSEFLPGFLGLQETKNTTRTTTGRPDRGLPSPPHLIPAPHMISMRPGSSALPRHGPTVRARGPVGTEKWPTRRGSRPVSRCRSRCSMDVAHSRNTGGGTHLAVVGGRQWWGVRVMEEPGGA